LHIDYQKAPSVVQRFGDVKRLITQTLDPILTAYFRDVAQTSNMLDLLTKREEIQKRATDELGTRFTRYDINVVAVLIGRPESREIAPGQADPIETLFDQLRMRRLADEQRVTYATQEEAAKQQVALNQARAKAERQTELTQSAIAVEIAANRGQAEFAEAEQLAKKQVTLAEGEARSKELIGKGESSRIAQVGLAEAAVTLQKVGAYRDPRLYALNVFADQFSTSVQPLVPSRLFISNGGGRSGDDPGAGGGSVLETLLTLILSEKAGINTREDTAGSKPLEDFIRQFTSRGNGDQSSNERPESAEKAVTDSR
jgi:regulator of protease activity HflC (stomatin/prohibitin superfamily)